MKTLFISLSILFSVTSHSTTDWEAAKDEDGIRVYTRKVDGWNIEEFKVICVMQAKRLIIYQTIIDISKYPEWYPDISYATVTKKISETEFYSYSKIDLPWPTDDRDSECHFKVTHFKDEKYTLIEMNACEKYKSREDGVVRMTKGKGFWKLTSKDDGSTVVHYQYLSDPAGSIPAWITNMFIVDNPFETIKALRTKVGG